MDGEKPEVDVHDVSDLRKLIKNIPPHEINPDEETGLIPGRGDLRISLTTRCNLTCSHCHNEGQEPPWINRNPSVNKSVTLGSVRELIAMGAQFGAKSVKFTGGEPANYVHFEPLLHHLGTEWQPAFPNIKKWGISSNGTPFLNRSKFDMLASSSLNNICIGIDSVYPLEYSKPSSATGVPGSKVFSEVVVPLAAAWGPEREIKINVVFTGQRERCLDVVHAAYALGVNVSVIEVNGIMGTQHQTRSAFLSIISALAREYHLTPRRYAPLNEIYLYDEAGDARIKFYQDHCADMDCGNCRKVHLRVNPTDAGWAAVPCFLQAQAKALPLVLDGNLSSERFRHAIRVNGIGPDWDTRQGEHDCEV
jgi:molybdenum cofactor biosynthesis enzyme MoaA